MEEKRLSGETKPEDRTETKLARIAEQSRQDPRMELKWLMPHFNRESLEQCFRELDGRKATGADGIRKEEYRKELGSNLNSLIARMKSMSYRPGPVREVLIPKEGQIGKSRPLGVSNFEDKIVQLMMSKILEAIYEPRFRECSYGFRPGRSCHTAIKSLYEYLYRNRNAVVIDVDLKNYFGSLNHEKLLDALRQKIKDDKFMRYVVRMLKAGILSDGELKKTEEGSPQGSIVSPILSNIYGHYAIDCWFEKVMKKEIQGKAEMFRYADDIVICCEYREDAERIKEGLKARLAMVSLEMSEEKSKLVPFDRKAASRGEKQGSFDFLGFTFYFGRSRRGNMVVMLKTSKKRVKSKLKKISIWMKKNRDQGKLEQLWRKFVIKLNGHSRYYGVSFNTRMVGKFIFAATRIFFKWMNRRSQRKSFNWDKFKLFLDSHSRPISKLYHPLY